MTNSQCRSAARIIRRCICTPTRELGGSTCSYRPYPSRTNFGRQARPKQLPAYPHMIASVHPSSPRRRRRNERTFAAARPAHSGRWSPVSAITWDAPSRRALPLVTTHSSQLALRNRPSARRLAIRPTKASRVGLRQRLRSFARPADNLRGGARALASRLSHGCCRDEGSPQPDLRRAAGLAAFRAVNRK